jgi:O-acetylserine/cysteine efflux transporter
MLGRLEEHSVHLVGRRQPRSRLRRGSVGCAMDCFAPASLASLSAQLASLVAADECGWLALAYTIFIGGIVGFGLWFWLIARCSMGRVAPFGLLLPVFAVISSVLFLGDPMTPKLIVGGLLTISGVAITQVRPTARPV